MHVKGFADQTRTCTHTQTCVTGFGWCFRKHKAPPLSSPGSFFRGGRPAGVVCAANRAEAEGRVRGASLLKGSCNFHSRVLLKLVPRPLPRLNTLVPSRPVRPSTPQPHTHPPSPNLHLHLCDLHWEGMAACWSVCVDV